MAERCSCCRRWEEHVYSNCLTRRQNFHFFKVLLDDFSHRLRIPKKFVRLFQEKLPETVDLKDHSRKRWHVKLKETDGDIFLEDGWEEFVRDHSLDVGDFLVFRFNGDSCFRVLIFDTSGCEKESLYSCDKQEKKIFCAENPVIKVEEREDSADAQLVSVPIRAIGSSNVQAALHQAINLEPCQHCSEMGRKVLEEENNSRKDAQEAPPQQANHQKVLPSRKRMGCPDKQDSSDYLNGERRSSHLPTRVDYTANESIKADPEETTNSSRKRRYKRYPQHFISNRRPVTEEEKKRVFLLASAVEPTHPAFISIMKPSHVYRKFFLTVPIEFASEFLSRRSHRIILHAAAGEWEVHCNRYNKIHGICFGWKEFVVGNNLEEGDVLIFEFASWTSFEHMNVRIFRVVEDAVPPTLVDTAPRRRKRWAPCK